MRTKALMAAALLIALTSINLEAQRRRTDEPANRPAGEPDRRKTDDNNAQNQRSERKNAETTKEYRYKDRGDVSEVHTTRERVVYKKSPKVYVVRNFSSDYHHFRHRDYDYYEHEGRYYNFNNGKYILIAPPVGMRVRYLPYRYVKLFYRDREFFYFNGVFYSTSPYNDEYEIIEPPIGAIVNELPYDADKVEIDEQIYYEYNNTLYKKIRTEFGKAYEVVGKI